MKPEIYNAYTAWFEEIWREYDLLIAAGCLSVLAFMGLMFVCCIYILWLFGEILED